jgi:ABC-2 type transport system permease protein
VQKYIAFFKFKFLEQLQFRGEFILWFVLDLIPFAILFLVLKTLFQQRNVINTYTISDIIFYYFAVVLIDKLILTHFEGWRVQEIRDGKIDRYLVRPFAYLQEVILSDLATRLFSLLIFLPFYILFFFITQHVIPFALPQPSGLQLMYAIVFILFAYFMELTLGLLIVLLGFWFEGSQGLEHFKWIVVTMLSGSMIPLEFLPNWMQTLAHNLPFKYMFSVPINMLQGRSMPHVTDLLIISATVFCMTSLIAFTWKKAIYTYTSSGG